MAMTSQRPVAIVTGAGRGIGAATARELARLGYYPVLTAPSTDQVNAVPPEGAPHGIRVHTIAPSGTETEMFRAILSKEQVPTEKIMQPGEVADIIAQCVTGELRYTSGEVIYLKKTP